MTVTHGMDIPAVRSLAVQMDTQADAIVTLMQQLTTSLQNTAWLGADRQAFESDWQGQHCAQLRAVADSLKLAAQRARQNADQQEQVSLS